MAEPIDFDDPKSTEEVKLCLDLAKEGTWADFLKIKFLGLKLKETVSHTISLLIIVSYVYLLARGRVPSSVHDTLAKIIIGAYLGFLFK